MSKYGDKPAGYDAEIGAVITPAVPAVAGVPLKYISLVTLAFQNSLLTIVMHYSRISTPPSRMYSAATAVLLNELLKGGISLGIAYLKIDQTHAEGQTRPSVMHILRSLFHDVFSADCYKLSIPATLYVIQNNLQYVAVSNLDAATFQVTYQMKILTTAAFSVLLLRKQLNSTQWIALLLLAIGVGVVQIQAGGESITKVAVAAADNDDALKPDIHSMSGLKGFLAVAAACFTSGLAGVYFEMVLKNSQADLWIRNVQLSLFSLLPALVPVFFDHRASAQPLLQNFGGWAWATVLIQVFGGLMTAVVVKYSDNILKGFATSVSILISFIASVWLFGFVITPNFLIGAATVLAATYLYSRPPKEIADTSATELWNLRTSEDYQEIKDDAQVVQEHPRVLPYASRPGSSMSRLSSSTSLSTSFSSIPRET